MVMANTVYYETFPDIYKFMRSIDSRPNNGKFGTSATKLDDGDGWRGTRTYEDAVSQFENGLPETAERMKKSLGAFKAQSNIVTAKARPRNHYYGYTPNVPAAIIGLPKSMRRVERIPQKTKTIGLLWDCCECCGVSAETLRKSGEAVLQLVYVLEMRGYRVRLDCAPFTGNSSNRDFLVIINLKQYGQNMDILKLSFPVTSPAMFRRFGFKWAEGVPDVKGGEVYGYGVHLSKAQINAILEKRGYDTKAAYTISVNDCKSADFDPLTMAQNLGIII
jgi:hypothetical protein